MCRFLEEVAVSAGHKVLIKIDKYSVLIVGDPQGILGQQPRPCVIRLLNITIILITCQITFFKQ
jgi:hypothetical protein